MSEIKKNRAFVILSLQKNIVPSSDSLRYLTKVRNRVNLRLGQACQSGFPTHNASMVKQSIEQQLSQAKDHMLETHLRKRGIVDESVLDAFAKVARERLVPDRHFLRAYEDRPLEIGYGATISQPYIVALTIQSAALKPNASVLEIGTGSGYQTALLAQMGMHVHSIELIPELSATAQTRLHELGYTNIKFHIGDGHQGWPEDKNFDAILLSAAPEQIPEKLLTQLKLGGVLVGPEGSADRQRLLKITKTKKGFERRELLAVQFVPMVRG